MCYCSSESLLNFPCLLASTFVHSLVNPHVTFLGEFVGSLKRGAKEGSGRGAALVSSTTVVTVDVRSSAVPLQCPEMNGQAFESCNSLYVD